jgi:hypothetical protein
MATYMRLEEEYIAASRRGDAKIDIFRRLESAYHEELGDLMREHLTSASRLRQAQQQAVEVAQEPKVYYSKSPRAPPTAVPSQRASAVPWRARQRPRSASPRSSSSPEKTKRTVSVEQAIRMSFATLWAVAWASVASRVSLGSIDDALVDVTNSPVIDSDTELVLLIVSILLDCVISYHSVVLYIASSL